MKRTVKPTRPKRAPATLDINDVMFSPKHYSWKGKRLSSALEYQARVLLNQITILGRGEIPNRGYEDVSEHAGQYLGFKDEQHIGHVIAFTFLTAGGVVQRNKDKTVSPRTTLQFTNAVLEKVARTIGIGYYFVKSKGPDHYILATDTVKPRQVWLIEAMGKHEQSFDQFVRAAYHFIYHKDKFLANKGIKIRLCKSTSPGLLKQRAYQKFQREQDNFVLYVRILLEVFSRTPTLEAILKEIANK